LIFLNNPAPKLLTTPDRPECCHRIKANVMRSREFHCTVLELPPGSRITTVDDPEVRELPPWADPMVARLLAKYRLQAALADSLSFLQQTERRFEDRLPPWGSVPANSDS
jgi:hypothetical protein